MSTTNNQIKRQAPRATSSLSAQQAPFPKLSEHCPELVRRFPELARFDEATARWTEGQRNAASKS